MIAAELIVAINYRNLDAAFAQSDATTGAITSRISNQDRIINLTPGNSADALRVLVTHRQRTLPNLLPGLAALTGHSTRSLDVTGLAVMEEAP